MLPYPTVEKVVHDKFHASINNGMKPLLAWNVLLVTHRGSNDANAIMTSANMNVSMINSNILNPKKVEKFARSIQLITVNLNWKLGFILFSSSWFMPCFPEQRFIFVCVWVFMFENVWLHLSYNRRPDDRELTGLVTFTRYCCLPSTYVFILFIFIHCAIIDEERTMKKCELWIQVWYLYETHWYVVW